MDPALKKKIAQFCLDWGRREAGIRLRNEGLKQSMVDKLLSGNYKCQPDEFRLLLLEKALRRK